MTIKHAKVMIISMPAAKSGSSPVVMNIQPVKKLSDLLLQVINPLQQMGDDLDTFYIDVHFIMEVGHLLQVPQFADRHIGLFIQRDDLQQSRLPQGQDETAFDPMVDTDLVHWYQLIRFHGIRYLSVDNSVNNLFCSSVRPTGSFTS